MPFFSPGDLPNLGIEPTTPAWAGAFFSTREATIEISLTEFSLDWFPSHRDTGPKDIKQLAQVVVQLLSHV